MTNVFPFQTTCHRVKFLCPTVVHEDKYMVVFIPQIESYSLENDTWSDMGKHCHTAD